MQKFLHFCAAISSEDNIAMTVDQIDGPTAYLRHGDDVFHNSGNNMMSHVHV